MPAFSKTLSADQIKPLVAHIRELGKMEIDQRGGYGNEGSGHDQSR